MNVTPMLRRAIGECRMVHEPPSFGLVADKLPPDFELGDDELAAMLREMKLTPVLATPEPERPVSADTARPPEREHPRDSGDVPSAEPPRDTGDVRPEPQEAEAQITREQSQHLLDVAHVRHDNTVIAVKLAQQRLSVTKRELADAITSWQVQVDPITPEQRRQREMRRHLASEQAKREARGAPHPNAQAFVQKRMTNSGNHRGAFPRQYQGRNIRSV